MANPEHKKRLATGIDAWNSWRKDFPRTTPDLSGLNLRDILQVPAGDDRHIPSSQVSLAGIDFSNTCFDASTLDSLNLSTASLRSASLVGAKLKGVDLSGANLMLADFTGASLDSVKCDRNTKCKGIRIEQSIGGTRFRRAVLENDYIENFRDEHSPLLTGAWRITSDYGRSVARVGLVGLMLVVLFAVPYYLFPSLLTSPPHTVGHNWYSPTYFSLTAFASFGYSNADPANTLGEVLTSIEVILGYLWLGYLLSIFAYRASARV
jgi:hypothetical protein